MCQNAARAVRIGASRKRRSYSFSMSCVEGSLNLSGWNALPGEARTRVSVAAAICFLLKQAEQQVFYGASGVIADDPTAASAPAVVHKMQLERLLRCFRHAWVIAKSSQCQHLVKTCRCQRIRPRTPQTESMFGKPGPREVDARINFATGCNVGMSDKVGSRDIVAFFDLAQQCEKRINLHIRKGLKTRVVEFDPD